MKHRERAVRRLWAVFSLLMFSTLLGVHMIVLASFWHLTYLDTERHWILDLSVCDRVQNQGLLPFGKGILILLGIRI